MSWWGEFKWWFNHMILWRCDCEDRAFYRGER